MTNKLKIWVICLVVVIIGMPAGVGLLVRAIPSGFQPSSDGVAKIFGPQSISQEVRPADNFSGVAVSLKNPNLVNKQDLVIEVSQQDQVSRQVILNGRGIADGNFVKIRFSPIVGSAGQMYVVKFAAPSTADTEALGLVMTDHRSAELGETKIASQSATQAVALITMSRPENPLGIIGFVYGSMLSRLWADPGFGVIYVGLVVIVAGWWIKRWN